MINIIDLAVGAYILFYLLRNAGGPLKTVKNFLVMALLLVVFGIVAQLMLNWPITQFAHKTLDESYLLKLSNIIIKWTYPSVEHTAPKIDAFMKEKILSTPTPEVKMPNIIIKKKDLPNIPLPIPELPKIK